MRKSSFSDDELIERYIIYSTLKNIINRKNRGLGLKDLINKGHVIGNEIHNMNKVLSLRKIKIMRLPSEEKGGNKEVYSYMIFKNGWRSEHTLKKSTIQNEIEKIWNDLHKKKD